MFSKSVRQSNSKKVTARGQQPNAKNHAAPAESDTTILPAPTNSSARKRTCLRSPSKVGSSKSHTVPVIEPTSPKATVHKEEQEPHKAIDLTSGITVIENKRNRRNLTPQSQSIVGKLLFC